MISQLSLAGRRSLGAASALGVGTASIAWATLAMLGLAAVLHRSNGCMRQSGSAAPSTSCISASLLRAGVRRDTTPADAPDERAPLAAPHARDYLRAYRSGLFTCLTNPKSCAFWTSVFAAMLPAHVPLWFNGAVLETIGVLSAGWYSCVAYLFASRARSAATGACGARSTRCAAWRSSASVQNSRPNAEN